MDEVLLFAGSAIIAVWGTAHLANTKGVLQSFEPMTTDTRRVVAMEWIMEGLLLVFLAVLVVLLTVAIGRSAPASILVYRVCSAMLVVMAIVSLFTGARVSFWAYKLCPAIFGGAAILFFSGSW